MHAKPYTVLSDRDFAKHYYAGAERVCETIPIPYLQYLPFGERYIDQRTSGYSERFTFTGKERDEETGYGYHGARYYDADLMYFWFSVDPLSDKYPSVTPYNYCAWNPVRFVDLDGRDVWNVDEKGNISRKEDEYGKRKQTVNFSNGVQIVAEFNQQTQQS